MAIDGGFGRPRWNEVLVVLVVFDARTTGLLLLADRTPRVPPAVVVVVVATTDPNTSGDPLRNMDMVLLAFPVPRVSGLPAGSGGTGFRSLKPGEILEDDDDGDAEVLRPPNPPRCALALGGVLVVVFVRLCALCKAM